MNPNIIAGLINREYDSFNVFSFENRLKLQKFTYILQSMFELNIGYDFNWYHYGPYCMELTKDAFNINFEDVSKVKFADDNSENKFEEFVLFIKDKDIKWLEIVSSIHFLSKLGCSKQEVIDAIKSKRSALATEEPMILRLYSELKSENKI